MSGSNKINVDIVVNDKKGTADIKRFGNEVVSAGQRGGKSLKSLNSSATSTNLTLGSLVKTAVVMSAGYIGVQSAVQGMFNEFKRGLSSIEDFNLNVAASAAYITTFSKQAASGDLAGGFAAANEYAGALATKLEMIDSKTIASGKDLQTMSETFIQHGVLLDINNKKQIDGFTNIATALALVTAGQNKDIQMRQEINALLMGQIRATDRLPKLLQNIDPQLEEHLVLWKKEGTLIENVGKLLQGFSASTGQLDDLWATVGSTMETIHNRVLRGAFKPIFADLIGLAKDLNKSLMDAEGNLTPLAREIQDNIAGAYEKGKKAITEYGGEVTTFIGLVAAAKVGQIAFNAAINANPFMRAVTALGLLNEGLKTYNLNIGRLVPSYNGMTESLGNVVDVMRGVKDADTGEVLTRQAQVMREIAGLEKELSADKSWYQFQFMSDPAAEKAHVDEIKGKISNLKEELNSLSTADTDMQRERMRGGGEYKAQVVELTKTVSENADEQTAANKKAATDQLRIYEDLAADRRRLDEEMTDSLAKEGKTQTEIELYEIKKRYSAALKTAGNDMDLKEKVVQFYGKKERELTLIVTAGIDKRSAAEWEALDKMKDGWKSFAEGKAEADERANDEIVDSTENTTNVFVDEWSNAMSSIQSSIADMIYEFDFSMDSILDIFKRMLAEMLAAIIMSGIKDGLMNLFGGSGGFLGGMFGSGTGGGGGGIGSMFGGAGGPATTTMGQIGGGVALAGGAYGMYSGARNISNGNTGTGVMQAGLGAASAYQGAVTLGLIESGTATALAQSAAAQLGINVGSTVGASGAGHASVAAAQSSLLSSGGSAGAATTSGASSSLAAAEQSYLASTSSTGGTAATTSAGSGGMAAGAAAGLTYATVAAAAILVATGAIAKANRPSASAQIDEAGITPDMLGQFYNGMAAVRGSILATVPTLAKYETAQYNAKNSLLALTSSTSTLALKYDETAPAGHRWSKALAAGSTALHEAIKSTYKFGESLGYADGEINTSIQAMETEIESVQALTDVMSGAADATDSMENSVSGLTSATQSLENATGSADSQVLGFSQMIVGLGGAAGTAAQSIGNAAAYILDSAQAGAFDASKYQDSDQYHAVGGIFPGITRWGSHVIGEKGAEALIPLPYGPDTFEKLFKKLDNVKGGGQAIHNHIYLDGREIATYVKQLDSDLQSRGFSRLAA